MQGSEWDVFLKEVLSHVKFRYDHNAIYFELLSHMEDRYEDFRKEGMSEEDAKKAVLLCMGEAEEIGEEMNRAHNPVLGWIWWGLRWVLILLVIVNMIPVLRVAFSIPISFLSGYTTAADKVLVYEIPVDERIKSYDTTYFIDVIRYYADGDLEVRYATWQNPFAKSEVNGAPIGVAVYDKDGTLYNSGSGYKNNSYYGKGLKQIREVPLYATEVVISDGWRELLRVSITEGRVMAQ